MSEDLKRLVGVLIRTARKARGMTQQQLAERVGVSVESVSNIERGKHTPTLETLVAMSLSLDTPVQGLLRGAGHQENRSVERLELEARLGELGKSLSDPDLKVAIAQVEALTTRK